MSWSRASELERALVCPASTHLDRPDLKSDRITKKAEWGSAVHEWVETGKWPATGTGRWLGKVPLVYQRRDANLIAAGRDRLWYWPSDGVHERSYALDVDSMAVGMCDSTDRDEREAWKKQHDDRWLTGTADYVGDVLGVPWCDDVKTGDPEWLPADPWELWQLRMYALCIALLTLAPRVWVSITSWPQYPADGIPKRVWNLVERTTILETVHELRAARAAALASKNKVDARPGRGCGRWLDRQGEVHYLCQSASICPAILPADPLLN